MLLKNSITFSKKSLNDIILLKIKFSFINIILYLFIQITFLNKIYNLIKEY